MFVTNEATVACCGQPASGYTCGQHQQQIANENLPVGGSLADGQVDWAKFYGIGGESPLAENQAADFSDTKPAGGGLGLPKWDWEAIYKEDRVNAD